MQIKSIKTAKNNETGEQVLTSVFEIEGQLHPLSVSSKTNAQSYQEALDLIQQLSSGAIDEDTACHELLTLLDLEQKLQAVLEQNRKVIGSKIVLENGELYYNGEVVDETLADYVLSIADTRDEDPQHWEKVMLFLDKLHQNVSEDIRKNLFRWMQYELDSLSRVSITETGNIIGYKGCTGSVLAPTSINHGKAYVDGVLHHGSIPNPIGSVISMPRAEVQHDSAVGCSAGLHVGSYDYASSWGPVLLLVEVNPRDIVSVPYECSSQKMRVCEYRVLEVTENPYKDAIYTYKEVSIEERDDYVDEWECAEVDEVLYFTAASGELKTHSIYDKISIEYASVKYGELKTKSIEGEISKLFYGDGSDIEGLLIIGEDGPRHIKVSRITDIIA